MDIPPADANTGAMGLQPGPTENKPVLQTLFPIWDSLLTPHTLNIHPECHDLPAFGQNNSGKIWIILL